MMIMIAVHHVVAAAEEVAAEAEVEDEVVDVENEGQKNTSDQMDTITNSHKNLVRIIPNSMNDPFTPCWQSDCRPSSQETFVPLMQFKWS